MSNFLDNVYGTLFCPDETFEKMRENPPIFQGFLIVILISILKPLLDLDLGDEKLGLLWFGVNMFNSIFFGVSSWLSFAFFLELVASIFGQAGKIKTFLTLFAFALMPWIFAAPIELFKIDGAFTKIIAMFLGLFIWLWVIVLVIVAIIKSYQLSFGRTLALIIVPFLGSFLVLYWFIGFFSTLFQILKV